tara:strand:+ start:1497 stop:1703 length:207 start_codon:yes stop_codon:yes gene_type:complete
MVEFYKVWKYALGSFNDNTTHKYDDAICIIRTGILLSYLITNTVICAGVIRHWNNNNSVTIDTELIKK